MFLEPTPQSLKQGAAERLKVLEAKHASVVAAIAEHYPVVLITKGDLFHQEAKIKVANGLDPPP